MTKKKKFNYSDLSTKELELLKNTYVDLKVNSMNNSDLRDFVIENISLQIKNTIGNEEELEAWNEMEKFFKDEFENIIRDIKLKMSSQNTEHYNSNIERAIKDMEDEGGEKKLDMWED